MRAWLAFSIAAVVAMPGAARAQETVVEAPEIVVEGEQPVDTAVQPVFEDRPVATEVVKEREIRALPVTNAADLVGNLPGLQTQSRVQGEEAVVSIEGLPPEYTRVLVDGERYSGSIGGTDDLRDFPLVNVERVEVMRGTQGVRQGGEGAGGVVDLVTRRAPEQGGRARIDGGGGSDGKILASSASELRVGPVGLTLSGAFDQIDGFDPRGDAVFPVAGGEDSRRFSRDLYGTATWSPWEPVELHSRLGWRSEDENFVPIDAPDATQRRDLVRWIGTHGFDWTISEATRAGSDLTWYRSSLDSQVGRPFTQHEEEWKLAGQAEHFLETGPVGHAITVGYDLRRPSLQVDEGLAPAGIQESRFAIGGDVDESFRTAALFLEDEIALHDRVSLLAGLRGELHSEFGRDVMPQVALLVRPHETLRLRLSWGLNRRPPTLKDLYQPAVPQLDGAYFLVGNPELEPESSTSYRAGFEWTPEPRVTLAATGFWNEIDDAIRSVRDPMDVLLGRTTIPGRNGPVVIDLTAPLFRKENLDRLRTRGVETELRLRPHPRVELALAYTYLQTQVIDSNLVDLEELPNAPPHVVDARVSLRVPRSETSIALLARWRDRALVETIGTGLLSSTSTEQSDPSLVVDVRVVQPIRSGVDLYADFQNVTNEDHVDSYAIRGFTFFVGVRADLDWAGGGGP
jgi:outer membrane receptor for ferrienterochelin and colicins